ncbi:hypothetical protein ElyMa_001585500 [Elysia marginata]|uniref:Uncharacterized protein n=1 Tax=Elysia marginata TaxID=1093978 RepID=A0AAV4JE35_9GAST|nr:hypothetical protein ElyMa_001585500 [Elysia marginata]
MQLLVPLSKSRYLTIISAYVSTLTSWEKDEDPFYEQFDQTIRATLVVLDDLNTGIGNDSSVCEVVPYKHLVVKANGNGLLLLSKCTDHRLCTTNTLADKHKTS